MHAWSKIGPRPEEIVPMAQDWAAPTSLCKPWVVVRKGGRVPAERFSHPRDAEPSLGTPGAYAFPIG